mmetsp:Transcript_1095/g.3346  ORF Transcript_1095/g.3346 Transcript_1095/m.3346 type:complete len:223 (+) Transcript_1095:77-745(+)
MGDEEELPPLPEAYTLTTEAGEQKTSIGFTGKATAKYTNGDEYEGDFKEGIREGAGTYRYRLGDVFVGTFANNLKTGVGRVTYKKGGFFHGNFKDGVREGEGTFQYPNGDIYSGMWQKNKRNGKGTYVFTKTKYFYEGDWKDGQMISGIWSMTDGTKFVGNFVGQKPAGDGVWQMAKGTHVEGAYVQQVVPIDGAPLPKDGQPPATTTRAFWKTATMVAADA